MLLSVLSSLYTLDFLQQVNGWPMCPPLLILSFAVQRFLGLMSFHLSIFCSFVSCALARGHIRKSVVCSNILKHFSYVFFQVSPGFTCRSPIHFELSFVRDEKLSQSSIFCTVLSCFPSTIGWRGHLLTNVRFWHLCGEAAARRHIGLLLGLLICSIAVFFFSPSTMLFWLLFQRYQFLGNRPQKSETSWWTWNRVTKNHKARLRVSWRKYLGLPYRGVYP